MATTGAKKATPKKRHNRQHMVRGSAFIEFAADLRTRAAASPDSAHILGIIADSAAKIGASVRHRR